MKNSADLGGCYPPRPSASVDNTLFDLQNSSYPTKAEFNNCLQIAVIGVESAVNIPLFRTAHKRG